MKHRCHTSLLPSEPAGSATSAKVVLLFDKCGGRFKVASRWWPGQEFHVHTPHQRLAKLDVTGTNSSIGRGRIAAPYAGDDCCGHRARGTFSEDAGLWRSNTRDITNCIHIREARLEGLRINRDPTIRRH